MEKKKVGFASGIGFILAAAGSAVGLGNLWAFPYKTSANGGAAFVVLYVLCVLVIGFATMICEIFIGKRAQANPVTAYKKIHKNAGWLGMLAIVIPSMIMCYYAVLGGYTVKFALNSFVGNAGNFVNFSGNVGDVILCTAIFVGLSLVIVMAGVKGGIEKASKVLMPTLFIILLTIVVFALTLGEGVKEGLAFYLKVDFSEITWSALLAAMGQAFFSLSIGMGAMIVYGSYTGKEINLVRSTAMICVFDTLVALLGGLAIFPSVFHYMEITGVSADELGMGGIGLMFRTLPVVFEDMGVVGQVLSFLFFAMVCIAAVTSVISLLEVASQFIIQKFHISRKTAAFASSLFCFAVSVPIGISLGKVQAGDTSMTLFGQDWLTFFDTLANTVLMPVSALFVCIAAGWLLGPKQTCDEIEAGGTKLGWFRPVLGILIKFICPALIIVVEVFGLIDLVMPVQNGVRVFNANGLGTALTAYGILAVCIVVYFVFFRNSNTGTNEDEKTVDTVE